MNQKKMPAMCVSIAATLSFALGEVSIMGRGLLAMGDAEPFAARSVPPLDKYISADLLFGRDCSCAGRFRDADALRPNPARDLRANRRHERGDGTGADRSRRRVAACRLAAPQSAASGAPDRR